MDTLPAITGRILKETGLALNVADVLADVYDSTNHILKTSGNTKGTAVTLFGGAISASVTEANATVIDMTNYSKGSLQCTVNSGEGTFSLAVLTHETAAGVFVQSYGEKDDGSFVVQPAIVTIASTSTSFQIRNINAKYLKFVPTISGTVNATFVFTPSL